MDIVKFKNVTKSYGKKIALDNVSFTLKKGKIIGLLGPNGSGKTTIIKLINDLLKPDSGTIEINGEKPGIESKKIVSYLPERTYLNMNVSVKELLKYFSDFYKDFDINRAKELLDKLKINPEEKLKTMSKGTKEKVQLILVMSRNADLYVLDEPIGGVDPAGRDYILDTILTNFSQDSSILISTHLISDIERILDEVIFIKDGKIILDDNADDIREKEGKTIHCLGRNSNVK